MDTGLSEIARQGLSAAEQLISRVVSALDQRTQGGAETPALAAGEPPADLAQAWSELLSATLAAWSTDASDAAPEDGAGCSGAVVRATVAGHGHSEWTDLWIHNHTADPLEDLQVLPGPLRSADHGELPAACVEVERAPVAVAARSSGTVRLRVDVEPGTPPGRYRGLLLVDGLPDLWALLDVTVEPG